MQHLKTPHPLFILGALAVLAVAVAARGGTGTTPADLPNPMTTPGALNQAVTQADIYSTICVSGWTRTIRPSEDYTYHLKVEDLRALGYADQRTRDYELDHLISLELGGAPADPRNLWPEPYAGQWGARTKDRLENRLRELVCSGRMPLAQAQRLIASNWIAAYKEFMR